MDELEKFTNARAKASVYGCPWGNDERVFWKRGKTERGTPCFEHASGFRFITLCKLTLANCLSIFAWERERQDYVLGCFSEDERLSMKGYWEHGDEEDDEEDDNDSASGEVAKRVNHDQPAAVHIGTGGVSCYTRSTVRGTGKNTRGRKMTARATSKGTSARS